MAVLQVARLGNPILRLVAEPVDLKRLGEPGNGIQHLIDDMVATMREQDGVGLAAPQVSISLQLVVMESAFNERYPEAPTIPLTVLVNPVITRYSEKRALGWEGCLSLNDLRGLVPRSKAVTVEYFDRNGKKSTLEAEGFQAVVLQHEIDHLHGKVFLDRMTDLSQLSYLEEFETYFVNQEAVEA